MTTNPAIPAGFDFLSHSSFGLAEPSGSAPLDTEDSVEVIDRLASRGLHRDRPTGVAGFSPGSDRRWTARVDSP
ncbi:MAG: hypothetical protein QMB94_08820, partial [Phycisphaerales bacterium]